MPLLRAALVPTLSGLMLLVAACSSDDPEGGGGGGGGDAAAGGSDASGNGGGSGQGGFDAVVGDFTHCEPTAFHCFYDTGLFSCAEYSEADAATYQPICEQGGTWDSGPCDETGVLGACLANGYCAGMGIGFVTDPAAVEDARQSCSDTGGTWEEPPTP